MKILPLPRCMWCILSVLMAAPGLVYGQRIKSYTQEIPGTDVSFKMVAIPAGSFTIGSPEGAPRRESDEGPQKTLTISAFWMGEKEVTFAEWDLFFKNAQLPQQKNIDGVSRPTAQYIDLTWGMGRSPRHPANSMSQQAAMAYCKDRKSTRLNSSHVKISYAVFCLKKKKR